MGIPKNLENPATIADPSWADPGLSGFLASTTQYAGVSSTEIGKFKVPTLRNVDLRPNTTFVKAYGHNGYFKSLEEIVHFYNTWDDNSWPAPEVLANINPNIGNLQQYPGDVDRGVPEDPFGSGLLQTLRTIDLQVTPKPFKLKKLSVQGRADYLPSHCHPPVEGQC